MTTSLPRAVLLRLPGILPVVLMLFLFVFAAWPWLPVPGQHRPRTMVFYGFSILGEVMNQAVLPDFERLWKERTGEEVAFVSSFAGSGTITHQLVMGVPAELVLLSLELDAYRLSRNGVTSEESWSRLPFRGVVNRTPFIILVRPGNPRQIRDFADLARPGVTVVHPDPLTSGGANWAILAEYGAAVRASGGSEPAGHDRLLGIWRNVVSQASSARAARTQFENGFGDALVTYEQEAVFDRGRGRLKADIVYPRSTVLSEHTLVVLERNATPETSAITRAFLEYLWTPRAQRLFVEYGFRSVIEALNRDNPAFGRIEDPFLVSDFGGWRRVKTEIVDRVWKDRVLREVRP